LLRGWDEEKKRELNAETQRAQRREPKSTEGEQEAGATCGGILGLETKRKMGLCGGWVLL
jgi:hypothetical protein